MSAEATRLAAYLIRWDEGSLSWQLLYRGQVWATVCAYLPGLPPITASAARTWADETLKQPQAWRRDGRGWIAATAGQVAS